MDGNSLSATSMFVKSLNALPSMHVYCEHVLYLCEWHYLSLSIWSLEALKWLKSITTIYFQLFFFYRGKQDNANYNCETNCKTAVGKQLIRVVIYNHYLLTSCLCLLFPKQCLFKKVFLFNVEPSFIWMTWNAQAVGTDETIFICYELSVTKQMAKHFANCQL